jgi:hypothetical protein
MVHPRAQPARAMDISLLVRWCQGMCHLSRSYNLTLLNTFLRRRIPLRLWSWYLREKKLNSSHRTMSTTTTMTTTTIMRKKKMTTRLKKMKTTRMKTKMMRNTLP